jgi:hypothetical protein
VILSRAQLIATLVAQNIPVGRQNLFAPDELSGNIFSTVSREWVADVWEATIAELRLDAPSLLAPRQIGGGKTITVPRYLLNGFCCRGHALKVYSNGMIGFALKAAASPTPLDHDALAFGFIHYTAEPRAENLGRDGRHEILWGVDHDGKFFVYEPGDGDDETLTPTELASITLVFAQ